MSQDPGPGPQASAGTSDGPLLLGAAGVAAVPVVIALTIRAAGFRLHLGAVLAGALGWIIALALRPPVTMLARRLGAKGKSLQTVMVGSSGPLEETARLVVLLSFARSLDNALSVGFGWAAIEVLYTLTGSVVTLIVRNRAGVAPSGAQPTAAPGPSAAWGVLERLWASALHLGFSLAVAAHGLLVLPAAAAHSATNLLVWRALSRDHGIARVEIIGACWSLLILLVGIALWS